MPVLLSSIVSLAVKLPSIAVLVAGLVLASTRRDRLPGRARALLSSGAVVLLVVVLVTLIWSVALSGPQSSDWIRGGGYQRVAVLGLAVDVVAALGYPLGFGLLVGAALAGRRPADPAQAARLGSGSATGSVSESRRVANRQPTA